MPERPPPQLVARLRAAGCVFPEEEAALLIEAARRGGVDDAADVAAALEGLVARRAAGEPLEQVLGWARFAGMRIVLEPGVFVPRRRTEALATRAVRLARDRSRHDHAPVVVDLCCGSGAIGAAVARAVRPIELVAADIDTAAVRAARRNLEHVGARVVQGDLYDSLPGDLRGRIDVLVVNAPYVPTEEIAMMPPEARDHEARVALDGGDDGLDVHRRVAASVSSWLAPGGHLLIETSARQAPGTLALLAAGGLEPWVVRDEELGATVVIGRR